MRAFVFDIETVPDADLIRRVYRFSGTDDEVVAAARTQLGGRGGEPLEFLPVALHRVVAVAGLALGEGGVEPFVRVVGLPAGLSEAQVVADFWERAHGAHFVTYNGRGFDLPVLELRSLHHGLSVGWYFGDDGYRARGGGGHTDLAAFLSNDGALRGRLSLAQAAALVGLPGKGSIDGSKVDELVRQGALDAVGQYCLTDVFQTALLYLRVQRLRGVLDDQAHAAAARAVLDVLERMAVSDARVLRELWDGLHAR